MILYKMKRLEKIIDEVEMFPPFQKGIEMKVNKQMFLEYCKATGNKRTFDIEDYKKCTTLDINEFIYIGDHFSELKKKFNEKIPKKVQKIIPLFLLIIML